MREDMKYLVGIHFLVIHILFISFCLNAKASSFNIHFEKNEVTFIDLYEAKKLTNSISELLPLSIKNALNMPINIYFEDLGAIKKIDCRKNVENVYGHYNKLTSSITLNKNLLNFINTEVDKDEINCKHKSMYKTVKATVLHELAHYIDDHSNILKLIAKNTFNHCKTKYPTKTCSAFFDEILETQSISKTPRFLDITYWDSGVLLIKNKNFNRSQSPDIYEFENPGETFAVNFEYFILDNKYSCKKPILGNFLSMLF